MAYSRPRPRPLGRKRPCGVCHEPSDMIETLGSIDVCAPCMARIKARANHIKARNRASTSEVREAMANREYQGTEGRHARKEADK